ncbi:hypothetical protein ABG067_006377 [Albugo candida]|uniref:NADH-ubiquinone oxidoreductase 21kDa subunit N-terminal domain-containing protein n=1 Tax=Albugo candida TaxID=65357 RepID=A0A024GUS2_9STRA|nr:unnamed protein product [Albugo candida]|eukprot:CCI50538.1 unnamed protein product [Albugo candida]
MVFFENNSAPVLQDPKIPKFPVVNSNPSHKEILENVSFNDYAQGIFMSVTSLPIGYFLGRHFDPLLARRTMFLSGIIGSIGGVCLAFQNSTLRLQGFGRNDAEVQRYGVSSHNLKHTVTETGHKET